MPELPEVEVVRQGMEEKLLGHTITSTTVLDARSLRRYSGRVEDFISATLGGEVLEVARRGKYLWLNLDRNNALVIHLGMSGQVRLYQAGADTHSALAPSEGIASDPKKHLRIELQLQQSTQSAVRLDFIDQRIFGGMFLSELVPTIDHAPAGAGTELNAIPAGVSHIARDLLDPYLDLKQLVRKLKAHKGAIKTVLLNQNVVSGIGNIYADEALWQARVHYETPCHELSERKLTTLLLSARDVMENALQAGGTSFDALYVNVNGQSGYFSRSLNAYGRAGQPCNRCGNLLRKSVFGSRGTTWCAKCQKRIKKRNITPKSEP